VFFTRLERVKYAVHIAAAIQATITLGNIACDIADAISLLKTEFAATIYAIAPPGPTIHKEVMATRTLLGLKRNNKMPVQKLISAVIPNITQTSVL